MIKLYYLILINTHSSVSNNHFLNVVEYWFKAYVGTIRIFFLSTTSVNFRIVSKIPRLNY